MAKPISGNYSALAEGHANLRNARDDLLKNMSPSALHAQRSTNPLLKTAPPSWQTDMPEGKATVVLNIVSEQKGKGWERNIDVAKVELKKNDGPTVNGAVDRQGSLRHDGTDKNDTRLMARAAVAGMDVASESMHLPARPANMVELKGKILAGAGLTEATPAMAAPQTPATKMAMNPSFSSPAPA